jgi:hypothetical protein
MQWHCFTLPQIATLSASAEDLQQRLTAATTSAEAQAAEAAETKAALEQQLEELKANEVRFLQGCLQHMVGCVTGDVLLRRVLHVQM